MWSHQRTIQLSRHYGSGLWQMGILFTFSASIYVPIFRWVRNDTCGMNINGCRTLSPYKHSMKRRKSIRPHTRIYTDDQHGLGPSKPTLTRQYDENRKANNSTRIFIATPSDTCNKIKGASHIHEQWDKPTRAKCETSSSFPSSTWAFMK